jgi:hypothetical protein
MAPLARFREMPVRSSMAFTDHELNRLAESLPRARIRYATAAFRPSCVTSANLR